MFYIWNFLSCNSTYNKYIQTKQILFFLKQNKWVHFYDFLPSNKIHSNSNFTLNRNSKWFNIFAILHDWLCFFLTLIFWFYFFSLSKSSFRQLIPVCTIWITSYVSNAYQFTRKLYLFFAKTKQKKLTQHRLL